MKKLLLRTALLPLILIGSSTYAFADDVSLSVSADYVSEYVFRGVSYARGAIQPGLEVSTQGFTAGVWASLSTGDLADAAGDEVDVYAGYSWDVSDTVSADVGATVYHFPGSDGGLFDFGGASTFEVYAGLGFDAALSPSLYGYYDFDLEAFTVEGGISHSVPVAENTSLDLGLTAGLVTADGGGDYQYGTASASVGYGLSDAASVYVGANYSLSSEDTLRFKIDGNGDSFTNTDNLFWFGFGFATGF
ncbi:MAG: hypothetical protein EX271_03450 [Acidimicrobiales bacterium]|nr:hypothetical protein [Hyphomonadaceae bacterium]RZV43665.1 MAG: hypothetical protein EX271_03450 [Acidimicrobiales bacterium]